MDLLQITTTQLDTLSTGGQEQVRIIELLIKGGFMMVPIFLLSILAIYIFVERMLTIKKASKISDDFYENVKGHVVKGDINAAKIICAQNDSPIARMIEKGIARLGSELKNIEASIENVGKIEIYKLEKNLSLLATISGAAPMIGFLGTVTGMIRAFMAIAQEEGTVSPKLLSSGIYEAMLTTAAGLFVGIIAYLGYNYLVTRVQKLVYKMEFTSINFMDLLQEPQ
jgi:biopolymer transport protein ExbB